jgi:hypothetical protein
MVDTSFGLWATYLPNKIMVNGTPTKTINKYPMGINLFFKEYSAIISANFKGMALKGGIP